MLNRKIPGGGSVDALGPARADNADKDAAEDSTASGSTGCAFARAGRPTTAARRRSVRSSARAIGDHVEDAIRGVDSDPSTDWSTADQPSLSKLSAMSRAFDKRSMEDATGGGDKDPSADGSTAPAMLRDTTSWPFVISIAADNGSPTNS